MMAAEVKHNSCLHTGSWHENRLLWRREEIKVTKERGHCRGHILHVSQNRAGVYETGKKASNELAYGDGENLPQFANLEELA
ncbi:hypothetical protein ACA910_019011 [Epithemia clementina (nom. ined.)]